MSEKTLSDQEIGRKFHDYQREMGPKLDASLRALVRGQNGSPVPDVHGYGATSVCSGIPRGQRTARSEGK